MISLRKGLALFFFLLAFGVRAFALEPFVIQDIRVEGLQRIAAGTVFNYLKVKVGDRLDDDIVKSAIRDLFKTGFFRDVELSRVGNVLVVSVVERPSIASIQFSGNKEFDDEALETGLKSADVTEGRVFNPSILDKLEQEIKNQYFSLGKYAATIKITVTPLERNRVAIAIEVDEGETARIKSINIVGNEVFDDKQLRKKFELGTKSIFQFFSKKDRYSKQKLAGDLETLRSFYQDAGYLDFAIMSTQVSITRDKRYIYVTVSIVEGQRYVVSEYRLGGKPILSQEEVLAQVTVQPGSVFSRKDVTLSNKRIADRLADEGYAFANVNAIPKINKEAQTVSFTFFIDPGRRVYVRRINIAGNTTTRDEVIRRELRQLEGSWFSAQQIQRSRVRLQRLGFFKDVSMETPRVPGTEDQVDVNVTVEERATGNLLFGVGYSAAQGFLIQASALQRNLFGTGKVLQINVDNSRVSKLINIRYVDPYHTEGGISRGFQIFSSRVDSQRARTAEYITETLGGSIIYKVPIAEFNSVNFGIGLDRIDLEGTSATPPEIATFIAAHPSNDNIRATVNFARDTRNRFLFPTKGSFNRISLEITTPKSDLEYYRLRFTSNWFIPIGRRLTMRLKGEIGYGDGYGDTDGLPFFKNFFAGGATTVRGYKPRSLGPEDSGSTPRPLGGSKMVLANAELFFPFPGDDEGEDKRISVFVDAGQVFANSQNIEVGDMRASIGLGFHWFSPLGPLSFSYSFPLNDQDGDRTEAFQFTLGRQFQ